MSAKSSIVVPALFSLAFFALCFLTFARYGWSE